MFSGPDFLYANAFFPNKSTYVLSGLEPTGPIPDLLKLPRAAVEQALRNTETSLHSILANSFFRTNDMRASLTYDPINGTVQAKRYAKYPSSNLTSKVRPDQTTDLASHLA